ncbi:SDR family oxidoreductase [Corynebacterium sp. J010B-136]|uniref:SDR family oxidoreductase n=1 Tax=Corynebacterium sp. J010B-136 TaxID=2099401 RepID=UPI000CF9A8F9|nr:SDR family oxidoreductase [Corynebacterium sp. J010B-136]PQM73691.1 SDR family oxidoreductase [Corynebacterium sp. J010B-136]
MSSAKGAVLILGGRSDIGGELARRLCPGRPVVLAARGTHGMDKLVDDLRTLGATDIHTVDFDATAVDTHRELLNNAQQLAGEITCAIVAFGILGEQNKAEHDEHHAVDIATVDYLAQVSMLTVLSDVMSRGHIVAFSSIAGWRARRANYVYGSTKAGLDAFCQGLADKLTLDKSKDLALITARPGFVIGSMTVGMKPAPMSVTPDVVADAITAQIPTELTKKPRSVTLWIPRRLAVLAFIMRLVPRAIWRRMPR